MRFDRIYTTSELDPFDTVSYRRLTTDAGDTVTVPQDWGSAAVETLVADIFCPRPLPPVVRPQTESGTPEFLWPKVAEPADDTAPVYERDIRDVLTRVAGSLAYQAHHAGLFDGADDARVFFDELRYVMLHRIALVETSLLAQAGLGWAYGVVDAPAYIPAERLADLPKDFSPRDVPLGAIHIAADTPYADLPKRLRLLGAWAALDHPTAPPLTVTVPVELSQGLELATAAVQAEVSHVAEDLGRKMLDTASHLVMDACDRDGVRGFDPAFNTRLSRALVEARAAGAPESVLYRALSFAEQGFENIRQYDRSADADPLAAMNIVLSAPDEFIETALTGHGFLLVEAGQAKQHADAARLWDTLGEAVWSSGLPHLFFRDSAGAAEGLAPAAQGGLVFTPDTEAPAGVLNLTALADKTTDKTASAMIDADKTIAVTRLLLVALEASFAQGKFSPKSHTSRPVVIGYSGLAGLLMGAGLAYESIPGQTLGALATALVTGAALAASAEMADSIGACDDYAADAATHLSVMKDKMAILAGARGAAKGVMRRPVALNPALSPDPALAVAVKNIWDKAYALGKEQGFRHCHLTGLATPLAVQGILGTTARDVAPEAGLIRFEGFFGDSVDTAALYGKKINPAVMQGLKRLGYSIAQIEDIYAYVVGHGTLLDAPAINHTTLAAKGLSAEAIAAVEKALPAAQHIGYAFNRWTLGAAFDDFVVYNDDFLGALGFNEDDIDAANLYACGALTIEGAPHLSPDHLAVFDCLLPGGFGVRRVSAEAQIRMQAAVEPFLSGAVSQTLSLDHHVAIEDVQRLILLGWELGVKRLSLWREGASLLHPANLLPQKWETSLFAEEEEDRAREQRATPRKTAG